MIYIDPPYNTGNEFVYHDDFAELQAKSHVPMYMKDWIQKLDDFLKLSGKELLNHVELIFNDFYR